MGRRRRYAIATYAKSGRQAALSRDLAMGRTACVEAASSADREVPAGKPAVPSGRHRRSLLARAALVLLLLAGAILFFAAGGDDLVSLNALSRDHDALLRWVEDHSVVAPLAFLATYAAATALSLPLGALLTVVGGFLFGAIAGTVLSVLGATVGATLIFLAARRILGDRLRGRVEDALRRMDAGFRENAFNYLLAIRLIPVFPFWLVNIAPAFAAVPLGTFVSATLIGIVPGTFVYALLGNGLGTLAAADGNPGLDVLLQPAVLAPILGFAALAVAPVVVRKLRERRRR